MRKMLVYMGLDGSHKRSDWPRALFAVLPPLLLAAAVVLLDKIEGFTRWCLNVVDLTFAVALWLPLAARLPPFRRT